MPWRILPRRHKYHARATVVDGIRFDSTKEAKRYRDLSLLAAAGQIHRLEVHPRFPIDVVELYRYGRGRALHVASCGTYTADFRYALAGGEVVVEDVKSGPTKTEAYRLRKRLVEAIHGITIREV
jgi:hypothetical protein